MSVGLSGQDRHHRDRRVLSSGRHVSRKQKTWMAGKAAMTKKNESSHSDVSKKNDAAEGDLGRHRKVFSEYSQTELRHAGRLIAGKLTQANSSRLAPCRF